MYKLLNKMDSLIQRLAEIMLYMSSFLLFALIIVAVINRYLLNFSMAWYEEVSGILYMVLVYWGTIVIARNNEHLSVSFIKDKFKFKNLNYIQFLIWVFCLSISLLGFYYGMRITFLTTMKTVSLRIPNSIITFSTLGIGFLGMSLVYLNKIVSEFKKLKLNYATKKE